MKHISVTPSPKTDTLPKFRKNIFFYMQKPELNMIGGRKKSKKTTDENWKVSAS
jgi:hypothetical protein